MCLWCVEHFPLLSHSVCVRACVFSLQRSARPLKSLTVMGMGSSQSRSWEWPCAPWVTCQTRWSWKSSSRGWTWTVRQTNHSAFISAAKTVIKTSRDKPSLSSQATARWTLRSLSLFWAQSWRQLGCQISSTALTLTPFFGRCSWFNHFLPFSKKRETASVGNLSSAEARSLPQWHFKAETVF